jgi:hypothetical protein
MTMELINILEKTVSSGKLNYFQILRAFILLSKILFKPAKQTNNYIFQ